MSAVTKNFVQTRILTEVTCDKNKKKRKKHNPMKIMIILQNVLIIQNVIIIQMLQGKKTC